MSVRTCEWQCFGELHIISDYCHEVVFCYLNWMGGRTKLTIPLISSATLSWLNNDRSLKFCAFSFCRFNAAVSSRLGLSVLVGKLEADLHYVLFHSFHDFPSIFMNLLN